MAEQLGSDMSCGCKILTRDGGVSEICYGIGNPTNVFTAMFGWMYLEFDSGYVLKNQWIKTTPFGDSGWVVIASLSKSPQVTSGNGPPSFTPSTDTAIYFDKNTGAQYDFWNNTWH